MRPKNIYRSGPYGSCQDGSFQKETDTKPGPQQHPTTWTGYYLSCQDGPFETKLLPNRAHGDIQQPDWPSGGFQDNNKKLLKRAPEHPPAGAGPTEAAKTGLSKTIIPYNT